MWPCITHPSSHRGSQRRSGYSTRKEDEGTAESLTSVYRGKKGLGLRNGVGEAAARFVCHPERCGAREREESERSPPRVAGLVAGRKRALPVKKGRENKKVFSSGHIKLKLMLRHMEREVINQVEVRDWM